MVVRLSASCTGRLATAIAFEHMYSTSYTSTLVDKNTVAMFYSEALILPGSEPYPRMLAE
jgi:hypothetical protein